MAQPPGAGSQYHGKKRSAESEPEGDQPLAKRFGRLHIESVTNPNNHQRQDGPSTLQQSPLKLTDPMLLDDTKDTIFIHDIDREIEESDTQGDTIGFLPGVTGVTGNPISIPDFLIADAKPHGNELVLYQEPISLTIPKEEDNVRRAITETRARTRARQAGLGSLSTHGSTSTGSTGAIQSNKVGYHCGDAMDIDVEF